MICRFHFPGNSQFPGKSGKPGSLELHQRVGSIVALARKLLVIIYSMLKSNQPFDENRFLERKQAREQKRVNRMVNELTRLGYAVTLTA